MGKQSRGARGCASARDRVMAMHKRLFRIIAVAAALAGGAAALYCGEQAASTQLEQTDTFDTAGYKYIAPIAVPLNNELIALLVKNNWSSRVLEEKAGRPDSCFLGYFGYFKKGFGVRVTKDKYPSLEEEQKMSLGENKVYNIVFTRKYAAPIIKGISFNSSRKDIFKKLGPPHFLDSGRHVFGYKAADFYLFFTGEKKPEEIAVYKVDRDYDTSALKTALADLNEGESGGAQGIVGKWPDWDFRYRAHGGGWQYLYASRGLEVRDGKQMDITVYGNYTGPVTDTVTLPGQLDGIRDFKNTLKYIYSGKKRRSDPDYKYSVHFEPARDYVFCDECQRIDNRAGFSVQLAQAARAPNDNKLLVPTGENLSTSAGIAVYYPDKDMPNRELGTGDWYTGLNWLSDRYFMYVHQHKGVVIGDLESLTRMTVPPPRKAAGFTFKELKDGTIFYEERDGGRTYMVQYGFNKDGKLVITDTSNLSILEQKAEK
jgi:hypothetical protein